MGQVVNNNIVGAVGNVVFYTMNGKSYIRTKPSPHRKKYTDVVKNLHDVFGTVSRYGTAMIRSMSDQLSFPFTQPLYNRLRGWMRNAYASHRDETVWELSAAGYNICQVNAETDLRDFIGGGFSVSDEGTGKIRVILPEMNPLRQIKAPANTIAVNVKIIIASSAFKEQGLRSRVCNAAYRVDYADRLFPAKEILLATNSAAGDIAIVVIALEFEMDDQVYNKALPWLPAAIIAMGKMK